MRKIKNCPLCGVKMETTDYRYYFHPDNDCILHGFGIDINYRRSVESWNTRKPIDRILEQLEERAKYYDNRTKEYLKKEFDVLAQANACRADAFEKAIEIRETIAKLRMRMRTRGAEPPKK